jgi:hypothetical protein
MGGVDSQVVLFTGVVAGSVGQWVFDAFQSTHFAPASLFLGLIASVVTFPAIWHNSGFKQEKVTFVKWCVAFQNGFFWPALLHQVGQSFK